MSGGQYVSTEQVSQALGVSVSTVKRWVDRGILPAHKTSGGHRKVLMADVLRLVRTGNLPRGDLTKITSPTDPNSFDFRDLSDQLASALQKGSTDDVRSLIVGSYRNGLAVSLLADEIIAPAMQRIGRDWETDRIDVMLEHRATQLCIDAVHELKQIVREDSEPDRFLSVGCAPERDFYVLPGLLVEVMLLDAGWEVVSLGPNTPMRSLWKACEDTTVKLAWLSISDLPHPERFLKDYDEFYQRAEAAGIAVALGGRALIEPIRARMQYTMFGDGIRQLSAFVNSISSNPSLPRRGRPRRTD